MELPLQITVDCQLAAGLGGDQPRDRAAQVVGVEQRDGSANQQRQRNDDQAYPLQHPAIIETIQVFVTPATAYSHVSRERIIFDCFGVRYRTDREA
jgi:hypothetical protein